MMKISGYAITASAACLATASQAAAGTNKARIDLHANMPVECVLTTIDAVETVAGTQLHIFSNCNTRQFKIGLDGSAFLDIITATSRGRSAGDVTSLGDTLDVRPESPGPQHIVVSLTNSLDELTDLQISLTTG